MAQRNDEARLDMRAEGGKSNHRTDITKLRIEAMADSDWGLAYPVEGWSQRQKNRSSILDLLHGQPTGPWQQQTHGSNRPMVSQPWATASSTYRVLQPLFPRADVERLRLIESSRDLQSTPFPGP